MVVAIKLTAAVFMYILLKSLLLSKDNIVNIAKTLPIVTKKGTGAITFRNIADWMKFSPRIIKVISLEKTNINSEVNNEIPAKIHIVIFKNDIAVLTLLSSSLFICGYKVVIIGLNNPCIAFIILSAAEKYPTMVLLVINPKKNVMEMV